MENRESKRNKSRRTGIRRMIKMKEESGIQANKVGKKVKGRKIVILPEEKNRKGKFCGYGYIQHKEQ